MIRHVAWIMDRQRDLARIYRASAEKFAHERDLSRLLEMLADQEESQVLLLEQIAGSEDCPPLDGLYPLGDTAARDNFVTLLESIEKDLGHPLCDRRRMIERIVVVEFSRWRLLRNCLLDCAMSGGMKLQRFAAGMDRHRTTVAEFLAEEPDGDWYRRFILELKPVWKKRVLILDDDPSVAMILAAMVRPLGDAEVFQRGPDALTRLARNHYDAVISDYTMPEMDGIEFFHKALTVDPTLGDRFLFLTGLPDDRLTRLVEERGVRLLSKPCTLPEINEVVAGILEGGA